MGLYCHWQSQCKPFAIIGAKGGIIRDAKRDVISYGRGSVVTVLLHGQQFGDEDLDVMTAFPNLKVLILLETRASEDGLARLRKALPDCDIRCGPAPSIEIVGTPRAIDAYFSTKLRQGAEKGVRESAGESRR